MSFQLQIVRADKLICNEKSSVSKIIPILLEDVEWLPLGTDSNMAMILQPHIYINMCKSNVYNWSGPGVDELMKELDTTFKNGEWQF